MSEFNLATFSKDTPNKISDEIIVARNHTLTKIDSNYWSRAVADEPFDAKVGGKKIFCVHVHDLQNSDLMIGFTASEALDVKKYGFFGQNTFSGAGLDLQNGELLYTGSMSHRIIDRDITRNTSEIIAILTVSQNGNKKEIRFLCDGHETKLADVSAFLEGDAFFAAVCMIEKSQKVTTIPIDQIKTRTPEIENLINEYQLQQYVANSFPQVLELESVLLQQQQIQLRAVIALMNKN